MDIIHKIIDQTEKKLKRDLDKVNEAIEFSPFEESIEINEEICKYLNSDTYTTGEYEALCARRDKNEKYIRKVTKADYLDKLYDKQNDIERQLNDLLRLKMTIN